MSAAGETMCYAARYPGKPGYGAVTIDRPEWRKDTAQDIARWIKDGAIIERVTLEQARAGMDEFVTAKKAGKAPGEL